MTMYETNQAYENTNLFLKNKKEDANTQFDYSKAFFQGSRNNSWANKKKHKKEKW